LGPRGGEDPGFIELFNCAITERRKKKKKGECVEASEAILTKWREQQCEGRMKMAK
jgi:hypothetical protein